ncbi:MAG TPA: folate family ECF transporter S component [Candidatus Anaerotruncus excrementipullorum]|uniref:Folate family ECF transporter S component n=1 Tax=Candidatus Anaerotruncus excrementipullorum TaxID=2838465 RepID=A0A9D2B775_9FIRM|nr:folate family ECF transporter S component [Candidatus Anaerotruncus excrementipullorum]
MKGVFLLQKIRVPLLQELVALPALVSGSAREFKSTRAITGGAMLSALSVILNQFTIFFSQLLRVGFTFLAVGTSAMLFGPLLTGALGAITDILKYIVRNDGGAFFLGFTFNEFLRGFLYGLFFYRKRITPARVVAAQLTVVLVINLLLNPLWLSILYQDAFGALVAMRLAKNAVMLPIDSFLLYFALKKIAVLHPMRLA